MIPNLNKQNPDYLKLPTCLPSLEAELPTHHLTPANLPTPLEHSENQKILSSKYINYYENKAGKAWTFQEDEVLCEVLSLFAKNWRKMAQLLPGRTIKAC